MANILPPEEEVDTTKFSYQDKWGEVVDINKETRIELEGRDIDGIGIKGRKGQIRVPMKFRGRNFSMLMSIWASATFLPPARNIQGSIDIKLKPIIDLIWWRYGQKPPEVNYVECSFPKEKRPLNKKAICSLSGGLDSVGAMLSMIDAGLDVTACTVIGLNGQKYNKPENKAAKAICDRLGIELIYHEVTNSLDCDHTENPIKNLIFYNMLAEEAFRRQISIIGMGCELDAHIRSTYCPSDSIEVISLYRKYLWDIYYQHSNFLARRKDEAEYLARKYDILPLVRSCVTPIRHFSIIRKAVKKKVPDLDLDRWPNMCFTRCYKCQEQVMRGIDSGTRDFGPGDTNQQLYKLCELEIAKSILNSESEGIDQTFYYRDAVWAKKFLSDNNITLEK